MVIYSSRLRRSVQCWYCNERGTGTLQFSSCSLLASFISDWLILVEKVQPEGNYRLLPREFINVWNRNLSSGDWCMCLRSPCIGLYCSSPTSPPPLSSWRRKRQRCITVSDVSGLAALCRADLQDQAIRTVSVWLYYYACRLLMLNIVTHCVGGL